MATQDDFLALLRADNPVHQQIKPGEPGDGHESADVAAQKKQTKRASFGTSDSLQAIASSIKMPSMTLSQQLKIPSSSSPTSTKRSNNHTRSRSELPSKLPLTLSEQLLMSSYSKQKRQIASSYANSEWAPVPTPDLFHPLKSVCSEDSEDIIIEGAVAEASSHLLDALKEAEEIKMSPPHRRSKTIGQNTIETINNLNVGGRVIPAEDLLKLTNPDITAVPNISKVKLRPLSFPRRVYQNNFTPGKGNALQAAVASIFGLTLLDVPNFIEMPEGYEAAITEFYQQISQGSGKCAKIMLTKSSSKNTHSAYFSNDIHSSEHSDRVAVIRENCTRQIDSVFNDERMTMSKLELFNKQLEDLVQETLLTLNSLPKISQQNGIPDEYKEKICILRGKSPRGNYGHVVVARHVADGKFEMLHDPYPDGNFLDVTEEYGWCLFFV